MNEDLEKLLKFPHAIPSDKTYENVMALIRHHLEYYEPHATGGYTNRFGRTNIEPELTAYGHVQGLKEVLDHFDEPHSGHKAYCGGKECCTCGFSPFRVVKQESTTYYECKCGHKWTCNEYPIAVYSCCPACLVRNEV